MPKQGEIEYLQNIGEDARGHALGKPFTDDDCDKLLRDMASILTLLPKRPARVLDIGIGTGWTSAFLAMHGHEVTGADIAPDMIDMAKRNRVRYGLTDSQLNLLVRDYEGEPFGGSFHAAVFYDALHHAEDEHAALKFAYDSLGPGGVCITVEPGVGHSTVPGSIHAIDEFGVTEKDMPPRHIMDVGRDIGFTGFRVYGRPTAPNEIFPIRYRTKIGNVLRALKGLTQKPPAFGVQSDIVVMTK